MGGEALTKPTWVVKTNVGPRGHPRGLIMSISKPTWATYPIDFRNPGRTDGAWTRSGPQRHRSRRWRWRLRLEYPPSGPLLLSRCLSSDRPPGRRCDNPRPTYRRPQVCRQRGRASPAGRVMRRRSSLRCRSSESWSSTIKFSQCRVRYLAHLSVLTRG